MGDFNFTQTPHQERELEQFYFWAAIKAIQLDTCCAARKAREKSESTCKPQMLDRWDDQWKVKQKLEAYLKKAPTGNFRGMQRSLRRLR